jgi:hypothetical protein
MLRAKGMVTNGKIKAAGADRNDFDGLSRRDRLNRDGLRIRRMDKGLE